MANSQINIHELAVHMADLDRVFCTTASEYGRTSYDAIDDFFSDSAKHRDAISEALDTLTPARELLDGAKQGDRNLPVSDYIKETDLGNASYGLGSIVDSLNSELSAYDSTRESLTSITQTLREQYGVEVVSRKEFKRGDKTYTTLFDVFEDVAREEGLPDGFNDGVLWAFANFHYGLQNTGGRLPDNDRLRDGIALLNELGIVYSHGEAGISNPNNLLFQEGSCLGTSIYDAVKRLLHLSEAGQAVYSDLWSEDQGTVSRKKVFEFGGDSDPGYVRIQELARQ